jgi:hypothetical protein
MLPPMLAEVKQKLLDKPYARRSPSEDALLAELNILDKLFDEDSTIRKTAAFKESRIVSGPAGTCSCCGK